MEEVTHSNKDGRVPPQDVEAERSLIGAIMLDSDVLPEVITLVKTADFYDERHAIIFEAMSNLYDAHRPIDLLTLTNELKALKKLKQIGGASYLTELSNSVPAASHAKAYADIVKDAATRRRLIRAGTEIANKAYEDGAGVDDLVGKAEQELFEVSDNIIKSEYQPLSDLLEDTFERIELLQKNKGAIRGLKTGFRDIDKMTAGLQKGDLVIIGARPSMGKTTFAQNISYNIASINKTGVLFFSMEMAANEIIERLVSQVSGVDDWHIRTGNISEDEFARIGDAMAELSEIPIYIDDTSSMTIVELRNKARRAMHDHNIGIVIIDYLQLISGSDRYKGNRVQEVTEISRGLKILARELNIPVVALAQLSRNVTGREDPRPVLSDLRDSGSIEQDADLVMFIHRPDYYKQNDDNYTKTNITEILISKHRHGETGKVKLFFHNKLLKFMSLDETHISSEDGAEGDEK